MRKAIRILDGGMPKLVRWRHRGSELARRLGFFVLSVLNNFRVLPADPSHQVAAPMRNVKSVFEKISGFSTPFFGVSWHPLSTEGLSRKLLLLDRILESYLSVESGVWRAKAHFHQKRLPKDKAVAYLRPFTAKAAETRDYIRAHQFEWGPIDRFIDDVSIQMLLCFAQLLASQATKAGVDQDKDQSSGLQANIDEIREKLSALSYVAYLYHAVLDRGESSLDNDEHAVFRWLNAATGPKPLSRAKRF